jgi:AraC-like DNA-binding protein
VEVFAARPFETVRWSRSGVIPARDRPDFLAAPVDRCLLGPAFAIWCAPPDLVGVVQWGALDGDSVREVTEIVEGIRAHELRPAGRLLVDFREVTSVSSEVLLAFAAVARQRRASWSRRLVRQAVVIPSGVPGLMIAGALPSASPIHPLGYFRDVDEALAFLGAPSPRAPHAAALALAARPRASAPLLVRLRERIATDLAGATVESCARLLRVSPRTLQRALRGDGTSFRDELRRARLAAAIELLRTTDAKVDVVAERTGFGTGSRLSASLRRELGMTASQLRARGKTA